MSSSKDATTPRAKVPENCAGEAASGNSGPNEHTLPPTETAGRAMVVFDTEDCEMDYLNVFDRVPTDIVNIASGLRETPESGLQKSRPDETIHLLSDTLQEDGAVSDTESIPLRYASRERISTLILECDPSNKRARTCRVIMSRRKIMLATQTSLAFLVFLANIVWTAWAAKSHPASGVIGGLLIGRSSQIKNVNIGVHLLLNISSSLFLGAGNYCMQILVAPTGGEVRSAHAFGKYFDIGIHSIHNLRYITIGVESCFGSGWVFARLYCISCKCGQLGRRPRIGPRSIVTPLSSCGYVKVASNTR